MAVLNVLHVIRPQPVGQTGGADLHLLDLVERQRAAGHRVAVWALGNPSFARRAAALGTRESTAAPSPDERRWLPAVDIVHGHGYSADLAALALARRPGRALRPPVVLTAHGFIRSSPLLRLRTAVNERCLPLADAVITSSHHEAARLSGRSPGLPVQAIVNGVRLPAEPAVARSGPMRQLAYVGRLAREKRPDRFLRLAAELTTTHPGLRFIVIGSGPEEPSLRRLAQRLGLGARCQFVGLVDDVARRLATEIDLLVCLSETEGTPRAVLEAMAHGRPVVATAVGGLPELISHEVDGLLVPAGPNPVAAATRIVRRLLASDDDRQRLGRAAAASVRARFGLDAMATAVEAVYRAVLAAGERQPLSRGKA